MRNERLWPLTALACVLAGHAAAQAPGQAGQTTASPLRPGSLSTNDRQVEGVTVTAPNQTFSSSIDRRSYGVASDLQTTGGSIADALKNIPSLEVNVQGEVSLRGDTNVTILIDGRPSGMFRGEGRADALQQLPAEQIERVEVLTNPSAAFNPEGGAGVINLITKRQRGTGGSGSVRAQGGTEGRYSLGVSAAYNDAKMTISGDAGLRRNAIKGGAVDRRTLTPAAGPQTGRTQTSNNAAQTDTFTLRAGIDYDPTPLDRFSAEIRLNGAEGDSRSADHYETTNAAGLLTAMNDRLGDLESARKNNDLSVSWRRKLKGDDQTLSLEAEREHTHFDNDRAYDILTRLPVGPASFEGFDGVTLETQTHFKADYNQPLGEAKLNLGYDFLGDDNEYNTVGISGPGPATATVNPVLSNHFMFGQSVHAFYGAYERSFGDFTAQGGLRFERTDSHVDVAATGQRSGHEYDKLYPSLHLGYKLSDTSELRGSYSLRIRRPNAFDLNPFRVYVDPFTYRAGNPNLEPSETHSFELGYQRRSGPAYFLATGFYRRNVNTATDVLRDLGGGVLLSTRENLGESRSGGLELVLNNRFSPKLTYNINGTAFWNELDASQFGGGVKSAFTYSVRSNLNWQVTANDLVQINLIGSSKRITVQGYVKPTYGLNLGYRRKLNDRVLMTVSAQDVLDTLGRNRTVVDTPTLHQTIERRFRGRAVTVGLTYSFGRRTAQQQQRDSGFEFDGAAAGGE